MTKQEEIMDIATKRGFFFPSGEIYLPKAGFWTYGHLGTLLKQNWEREWRNFFLKLDDNYYEIDDVNILPLEVFKNSGHLEHFTDPLTECKKCHFRFRADELIEDALNKSVQGLTEKQLDELIKKNNLKCPRCNSELLPVKLFNMMFDVRVGATGNEIMYLRPETAQSPYLSFKREFSALREKLPMGLAVIGKAFRNEISPRQGFFRLREFTQAELQIFLKEENIEKAKIKNYNISIASGNSRKDISSSKLKLPKFYIYHLIKIQEFYLNVLKIPKEKFRFRELDEKERAFYNKIHYDIEVYLETLNGWKEVGGLHNRGDHDLKGHGVSITLDNQKIIPHVLELSFGVDRNIWALLDIFYKKEKERNLFKFPTNLAPIQVAIFPLVNKDKLPEKAVSIYEDIKNDFKTFYDSKGSIGKMYRRMDEIGCPLMITVDHQTLKDKTVTLRDKNTMKQVRIKIPDLKEKINKFLAGEKLEKLGRKIK